MQHLCGFWGQGGDTKKYKKQHKLTRFEEKKKTLKCCIFKAFFVVSHSGLEPETT